MENLFNISLLGLFFGTIGTVIGGLLGINIKTTSKKFLSFILSLASGLMTAVICFDLIPEALNISNIYKVTLWISVGILIMFICEIIVDKYFSTKTENNVNNAMLKTGIIISIGLAIHNFPEGLAIGSGFEASVKLGLSLAIAICIHDVPEGISMAIPLKTGGMKKLKIIWYVFLSGIATGFGAFAGAVIGGVSQKVISYCLAFAAGAMLYIVSGELIPEANKLYNGKMSSLGNIVGFILGMIVNKM